MNPGVIYIKTDKGRTVVAERNVELSGLQRRLLIVVDGKKTVNDLGALVRAGELEGVLSVLLEHALIEPSGDVAILQAPSAPGFAAAPLNEPPRAATNPQAFAAVRDEASAFVRERLGAAGAPICEAIERCNSPAELRKLLRGVEIFIGDRLSAETTHAFARHFGALLL
jgi:hypothetical protein